MEGVCVWDPLDFVSDEWQSGKWRNPNLSRLVNENRGKRKTSTEVVRYGRVPAQMQHFWIWWRGVRAIEQTRERGGGRSACAWAEPFHQGGCSMRRAECNSISLVWEPSGCNLGDFMWFRLIIKSLAVLWALFFFKPFVHPPPFLFLSFKRFQSAKGRDELSVPPWTPNGRIWLGYIKTPL